MKNWTTEKLFNELLNSKSEQTYWEYVSELRKRANDEVFKKSLEFANSNNNRKKVIGIDVLAQLGPEVRFKPKETVKLYFQMLEEEQPDEVLKSIFHGIGHNNDGLTKNEIARLTTYANSKNIEVKQGLVSALSGIENWKAVETLIKFSRDKKTTIRSWATFGIGSQVEMNNAALVEALWNRVKDKDQETKYEAIIGLAKRNDRRVKAVIFRELEKGAYGSLIFEAILKLNDRDFIPILETTLESIESDVLATDDDWTKVIEETIEELRG